MTLSFHIRHEVTSDRAKAVFYAIANAQTHDHITQYTRQETRLRKLGLVRGKQLTRLGTAVYNICRAKPELWGELSHFLHYTLWNQSDAEANGFSWTYRSFVDYIWQTDHVQMNHKLFEPIVSSLINQAENSGLFNIEQTKKASVSLSRDSLHGVKHWLVDLIPPVIENDTFKRRHFCSPELILLTTGWIAQQTDGEIGIDYLLTPERREKICRLCLLDLSALDRVLDWMLPAYPEIVKPGTSAGVYGRFLLFRKWPEISDLLPNR